jgi:hypothetical protein
MKAKKKRNEKKRENKRKKKRKATENNSQVTTATVRLRPYKIKTCTSYKFRENLNLISQQIIIDLENTKYDSFNYFLKVI